MESVNLCNRCPLVCVFQHVWASGFYADRQLIVTSKLKIRLICSARLVLLSLLYNNINIHCVGDYSVQGSMGLVTYKWQL